MEKDKKQDWEERVIKELKNRFKKMGILCDLTFKEKKFFRGSNIITYYFIDPLGIIWEYDLTPRQWGEIAYI